MEKRETMIMAVKEDCGKIGGPQECAGCGKKIHDKFILKVTQEKKVYWKEYFPLNRPPGWLSL